MNKQKIIKENSQVIIEYGATWCPPCHQMEPILQSLKKEGIHIVQVDVDQYPQDAAENNIQSIPTMFLYRDGILKETIIGAVPKRRLLDALRNN